MRTTTENKITECKTLNDLLNVLQSDYKTAQRKPGRFIKQTIIHFLVDKLNAQNPLITQSIKQKVLESENIEQFILIVKTNFNCEQLLSGSKEDLISGAKKLVALAGLKEKEEVKPEKPKADEKKK